MHSHSLVPCPNDHKQQGWTRMKPGARAPCTVLQTRQCEAALEEDTEADSKHCGLNLLWQHSCPKMTALNSTRCGTRSHSAAPQPVVAHYTLKRAVSLECQQNPSSGAGHSRAPACTLPCCSIWSACAALPSCESELRISCV